MHNTYESPAIHSIPSTVHVLKTSIDTKYLDKMIRFSEKHYVENIEVDNLSKRVRTDWFLQNKEGFQESFEPMIEKVYANITLFVNSDVIHGATHINLSKAMMQTRIIECWTALFKDGGSTAPHTHGNAPGTFSTVLYLNLPRGKTSLAFGNNANNKRIINDIREGDMLIFPSSLTHWGFDHDEGRIMTSANWVYTMDYSRIR